MADHGRHGPRRRRRRADQERGGARAPRAGRHAGCRQDRHADRGQARSSPACRPRRVRRERGAPPRRRSRAGERASPRGGDRGRRARAQAAHSAGYRVRVHDGQRRRRHRRGAPGRVGNGLAARSAWHRRDGACAPMRDALRQQGQTVMFVGVDGQLAGWSPWPIRSRRRRREAIAPAARRRPAHRHADGRQRRSPREAVAATLGIDEVDRRRAARSRSATWSRRLQAQGRAWRWPATASTTRPRWPRRTVGIAMGTGTDVAIESAGDHARQGRPARASSAPVA